MSAVGPRVTGLFTQLTELLPREWPAPRTVGKALLGTAAAYIVYEQVRALCVAIVTSSSLLTQLQMHRKCHNPVTFQLSFQFKRDFKLPGPKFVLPIIGGIVEMVGVLCLASLIKCKVTIDL